MSREEHYDGLLGAHALDATDSVERGAIEAYLDRSPDARVEVSRLEAVVATLASTQATDVPDGSWDRLLGRLRGAAPEADEPVPALRLPARPEPQPGAVVPPGRSGRARRGWVAATLAMAAAMIVGVALGAVVDRARPTADLASLARAAFDDPSSRQGSLSGDAGGPTVRVVVDPQGRGFVLAQDLARLPEGRTYQLWSLDGAAPVSLGLLGADPQVVAFTASPGVTTLAITDEPAPGATAPGQAPLVLGRVS